MKPAGVLRFWMPEFSLSTSVHGTAPQILSDLHALIFLPPLFQISNPSFALLPTASCLLPSEN